MFNWFDLVRQAQGGSGLDNLARQFNLSAQQTSAAIAALMPALAMGMQHAASDPMAMGRLFQTMMRGPYPAFFDNAGQAFTPQAQREGEQLLDNLFGSDEVSRRVARQAARFSGVGVDVLQQMLPLMAGIVAGGLSRMAQNQGAAVQNAMHALQEPAGAKQTGQTGAGAWAELWGTWMGLATGAPAARTGGARGGKTSLGRRPDLRGDDGELPRAAPRAGGGTSRPRRRRTAGSRRSGTADGRASGAGTCEAGRCRSSSLGCLGRDDGKRAGNAAAASRIAAGDLRGRMGPRRQALTRGREPLATACTGRR